MVGSNIVKFLMPILKPVFSSTNFISLFSFMKANSPILFLAQKIYTLLERSPLKWKFLRLSSGWVKYCQIPYANFETSRFLYKFYILLQFHERKPLYTLVAQTIYTLLERNPLKWKFLRLSSAQVKICKISSVNFEKTSRFLSIFCIPLQFDERLFLCTYFSSNNLYFAAH